MPPTTYSLSRLFAEDDEPPRTASLIGIAFAISGNIVISLALNAQKLAHRRIEEAGTKILPRRRPSNPPSSADDVLLKRYQSSRLSGQNALLDTSPLKPRGSSFARYGAAVKSRLNPLRRARIKNDSAPTSEPLEGTDASDPSLLHREHEESEDEGRPLIDHGGIEEEDEESLRDFDEVLMDADEIPEAKSESAYLKSKLWWFGFALMNIGEFGNFLSYAYAPASVVAPLGAFALIANCLFAPLLLKEKFRPRDMLGLALCIVGVVTIVLASKSSDVRLDPDGLIHAVSQRLFIGYSAVCIILASILALLSDRPVGHQHVWIDLGLCALFGGYTVLSTKGVSTLVSLEWIQIYRYWITYPILLVLIVTGIGQIRYLNRALMKFDSKVVIPTQFVLFNFTAIVGSAVLYRDFDSIPFEGLIIFLYGCASTFLGVFILAQPSSDSRTGSPLLRPTLDDRGRVNDSSPSQRNIIGVHSYPSPPSTTPSRPATPRRSNVSLSIPPSRPSHVLPLRSRASSTGLGLSPAAQYLLIGSGSTPPNVPQSLMNGSPFVVSPSPIRGGQVPSQQPQVPSQAPPLSRSQSHRESDGRA